MDSYRVIEVKQSIFADNNADADKLRTEMKAQGTFLVNLMSSPGSGKTTTLTKLLAALPKDIQVGIMEADIDSDVDAGTIAATGTKVIQLHTGGMCHLDADMTRQGVRQLGTEGLDLVILENVGNLVCPAEFDTGAALNMMILSVPECQNAQSQHSHFPHQRKNRRGRGGIGRLACRKSPALETAVNQRDCFRRREPNDRRKAEKPRNEPASQG